MLVTRRDIEILKFINDFGFCEMPQIEKQFSLKKPRSYQILKRLIKAGLLIHEYVLRNRHGIYRLTRRGAQYTDLPKLKMVSLGGYFHQLKVIDVYQQLMQQYPGSIWFSERTLMKTKFFESEGRLGRIGHTADGVLVLPDDKAMAIEVELTMKSKRRLQKIVNSYVCKFDIHEIWYFCPKKILSGVTKEIGSRSFVKIFELVDKSKT